MAKPKMSYYDKYFKRFIDKDLYELLVNNPYFFLPQVVILFYLFAIISKFNILIHSFGLLMVLFAPGAAVTLFLFPKNDELEPLERLILSVGVSVCVVPLSGLVLNLTPFGITYDSTVYAIIFMTVMGLFGVVLRKHFKK